MNLNRELKHFNAKTLANLIKKKATIKPKSNLCLFMTIDKESKYTGPDGTSNTISKGKDRELLSNHRKISDAIIVGAKTVFYEGVILAANKPIYVITNGKTNLSKVKNINNRNINILIVKNQSTLKDVIKKLNYNYIHLDGGYEIARNIYNCGLLNSALISYTNLNKIITNENDTYDFVENENYVHDSPADKFINELTDNSFKIQNSYADKHYFSYNFYQRNQE